MILVVLFIGAIILVSALRNAYAELFAALGQDVPQFVTWAAAILALGAIGFVPGFKSVSRGLMALVLITIIFQNYEKVLAGFQAVTKVPALSPGNSNNGGTGTVTVKSTSTGESAASSVPDYMHLDYETPPAAFSSASVGH